MKKFIDVEICGDLIKNRTFDNFGYCRQQGYWSVIIYSCFNHFVCVLALFSLFSV